MLRDFSDKLDYYNNVVYSINKWNLLLILWLTHCQILYVFYYEPIIFLYQVSINLSK